VLIHSPDVGSREAGRRRPTCPMVQVINGFARHGGGRTAMRADFRRKYARFNRLTRPLGDITGICLALMLVIKYNSKLIIISAPDKKKIKD